MSFARSRYGEFKIIDTDSLISKSLVKYGEWAQNEIDLIAYFIQLGAIVVDAGAFIGTHARAFSELVGETGKVLAFEPRHEIYDILIKNVQLSSKDNIQAINKGLGASKCHVKVSPLNLTKDSNFGSANLISKLEQSIEYDVIEMTTLDSFELVHLDFIKIDVEGMEDTVLNGAKDTIRRCRPIIFAECNSLQGGTQTIDWAQVEDYQIHGVLSSAYNQNNFAANAENIFGSAKEIGLLLIPTDQYTRYETFLSNQQIPQIKDSDDLSLLLLHKPQYPYEILANTVAAKNLSLLYPSPLAETYYQAVTERDEQIASLNQIVIERDNQIANIRQALIERDEQITNLNQMMIERNNQIVDLNQTLIERDEQITNLNQMMIERDNQIANIRQALIECDEQITNLNQMMIERNNQIVDLNQTLIERDEQTKRLHQATTERDVYIQTLVSSKSWLITKPMRWVGRILRGDFVAAIDPIKKALGLRNPEKLSSQTPNNNNLKQTCDSLVIPSPIKPTHPVAVILPVYRGIEMTKRCILAAMHEVLTVPEARIVVINDASPDVGMQEMLEQLAAQWPNIFVLLKNEKNLGFVGTVNRGLAYFPERDMVLLNSDVIVPKDWLHRLIDEAYSRPDIGTVTPFSNNATICSFPHFLQENFQPFNLDVDSVDIVFRHTKLPSIQAPTGVGFCMYIRRACLDVIGYLNQDKFGRGYGEENDLCQRALKNGWLNIISPNLYAYHEGGVSFSSDKQALVDRAMQVMDELHPNYHASVQSFIAQDPLKHARITRHIQLLSITALPKILHVSHGIGGGVGQHIEELAQFFSKQAAHLLLAPHGDGAVSISLGISSHSDKLIFQIPNEYSSLVELLKSIGVSMVHIHHSIGLESKIFDLPCDLDIPYLMTVHDYYWLNGNPTLTDENGRFPGFYSDSLYNPLYPLPQGMSIEKWQTNYRGLIENASCVIFPSFSTKVIFNYVYDIPNAIIAPHIEIYLNVSKKPFTFSKKKTYIIGVLGAIGREKGADLLEEIAITSKSLSLPWEFKLLGYAYRSLIAIKTTGPYKTQNLPDLIQHHGLDIVFFPAQWPETYSYTLSYALDSGLPIIAPNIGAFPERLSGRENTLLFNPLTRAADLVKQIDTFIEALSSGALVKASIFDSDRYSSEFYYNNYIPIASRNLKIVNLENISKSQFIELKILSRSWSNSSTWRSLVAHILWRLYMNPAMRWVNYVIPYSLRRFIKRSLTRRPIHDVINR